MFKDYDKYLSTSLKVYIFVLFFVFILKLVGMDYFGLDINNTTLIKINKFCLHFKIDYIYSYVVCYITSYFIASLTLNTNNKKLKYYMLYTLPITIGVKYLGFVLSGFIFLIVQIIYLFIIIILYSKKVNVDIIKNYIKYNLILLVIQSISIIFRNLNISMNEYNFIISILLDIDYILLIIIFYKLHFKKGEILCYQMVEVGLSSLKKINLKKLPKKLQANLHKFKTLPKQERLSISIYIVLSLLWNILSLVIILLIANLNHTFIECLFILTSFWLSKHAFGKPFHLPSMILCFIVSNSTYYILNKITTPLGISIFIPILLGVGLSYVTSKLVKKTYKPLYRGMPKELFNETILKIVDKDSVKYRICYDFYINKKSDLSLSFEYNYSIAGIRKIKDRINDKIKGLN